MKKISAKRLCFMALLSLLFLFYSNAQQKPMMGWSSWNTFRININENLIKATVDSLVKFGLKDVGYNYVNIDDGWFGGGRNTDGTVKVHPTKFPNGMKVIADYCHENGMKAGLYSDAGTNTCGSIWDGDAMGIGVGMWQHDEIDCNTFFKTWDYDYIKVDWCGGDATGKTPQQRYTAIRQAMDNTGKADLRLNVCRWEFPGSWVIGVGGSWRIATDISPNWANMIKQFDKSLYMAAYAGPGHFNDMDMCEVGNPKSTLTLNEEKTHFALWCILKSPLMIGCDLRNVSKEKLDIYKNTELIALNQDELGEQAKVIWRQGDLYVLACNLERADGKKRGIVLFNRGTTKQKIRVNFNDLYLGGKVQLRNLYTHTDLGEFEGFYEADVEGHGVVALKAEGEKRFDTHRYEGEYAFMNDFLPNLDLGKARYNPLDGASGGYVMSKLGGSATNWAEFRNVYCTKAGSYSLKVFYISNGNKNMTVTVNGTPHSLTGMNSGSDTKIAVKMLTVMLNAGNNIIRLSNDTAEAPMIDKIEISPIQITASAESICSGESLTLTASGAATYEWFNSKGELLHTGATLSFQPQSPEELTVKAKSEDQSEFITTYAVIVKSINTLSLNYETVSICSGQSVRLEASGASTYTWSPSAGLSATTGGKVVATPSETTVYTVVGQAGDVTCGDAITKTVTVTVQASPAITATPSEYSIQAGGTVQLTLSGADSYLIQPTQSIKTTQLARTGWTATTSSSMSGEEGSAVLDGNKSTIWQTSWPVYAFFPHVLTVDMKASKTFTGVRLTPRQNSKYGRTQEFKLSASENGTDYKVIAAGNLNKTAGYSAGTDNSDLIIETGTQTARYLKFESNSNVTGSETDLVTTLAEFNVYTALELTPTTTTNYQIYGNNGCESMKNIQISVGGVSIPTPGDGKQYTVKGMRGATASSVYLTAQSDNSGIKSLNLTSGIDDAQKWILEENGIGFALKNVKFGTYVNPNVANNNKVNLVTSKPSTALQLINSTDSKAETGAYYVKNVGEITTFMMHASDNWENRGWVMWNYTGGDNDNSSFVFTPIQISSNSDIADQNTVVWSEKGRIFVKGATTNPMIYSLSGKRMSAHERLTRGIYFVRVNGKSFKVVVP